MDFSPFLHSLFLAVTANIETSLHQLGVFFGAILAPWGSLGRPSLVLSPPMRENTTIWRGWETFWPPFVCVLGSIWAALASNGNLSRVKMVATSAQNLEKVDQNVHVDTASVFPSMPLDFS